MSLGNGVENGLGEVAQGGGAAPGRGEASSGASWAPGLRRYLGVGVRCTSTEPQRPFTLRGTVWGSIRVPPVAVSSQRDGGELGHDNGPRVAVATSIDVQTDMPRSKS